MRHYFTVVITPGLLLGCDCAQVRFDCCDKFWEEDACECVLEEELEVALEAQFHCFVLVGIRVKNAEDEGADLREAEGLSLDVLGPVWQHLLDGRGDFDKLGCIAI
jgi:hypothetical protein